MHHDTSEHRNFGMQEKLPKCFGPATIELAIETIRKSCAATPNLIKTTTLKQLAKEYSNAKRGTAHCQRERRSHPLSLEIDFRFR